MLVLVLAFGGSGSTFAGAGALPPVALELDDRRELTPVESARVHVSPPDWPMWRFDAARSADTPHRLAAELHLQWVRQLPAPQRAWPDRPGAHRRHASAIRDAGDSHPWVLASAHEAETDEQLVIEDVIPGTYRLRLHFAELDASVSAGMRVFDVLVDDRVLLADFDMVAAAGGVLRGVVREFRIRTEGPLEIHLRSAAGAPRGPAINGIELVADAE